MRNNETGEFELVVGNHQLLSGFFIVVLLFAVAFAMGYVVGQNSPRSAKVQAEAPQVPASAADSRPQPAGPVPVSQPPAEPPASDPAATTASAPDGPPQPTTQAAREPQAPPAVSPVSTAPPAAAASAPTGSFWQVMAVATTDAELIAKTLRDKGFPVQLSQGPNNLVRVLVGPYSDVQAMGKAKVDLESAGFLHPFRYQRDR